MQKKAIHRILQNHVIKTLIIILVFSSCSVSQNNSRVILKNEIERQISLNKEVNHLYLDFKLNDFLKNFVVENYKKLDFFKNNERSFFTAQLEEKLDDIKHKKIIYFKFEKSEDRITNSSKHRIYISNPIINKRKNLAIIAVSSGLINEMQGGIHLYKKEKNKWVFDSVIEGWVE